MRSLRDFLFAVTMTDKQRHEQHCNNCTGALPGEMNPVLRARKIKKKKVCPEKEAESFCPDVTLLLLGKDRQA